MNAQFPRFPSTQQPYSTLSNFANQETSPIENSILGQQNPEFYQRSFVSQNTSEQVGLDEIFAEMKRCEEMLQHQEQANVQFRQELLGLNQDLTKFNRSIGHIEQKTTALGEVMQQQDLANKARYNIVESTFKNVGSIFFNQFPARESQPTSDQK